MASLAVLGPALTIGAAVVSAGTAVYSAYSTYQQGQAQQAEFDRQAAVDELSGKNEYAASQREAQERRLESKLVQSRQQAYAAASGAGSGADAPTITKLLGDTKARGDFAADSVMYQGEQGRDSYFASATAKRITGANNFLGAQMRSIGTLAGGLGNLAGDLAGFMPSAPAASQRWGWRDIAAG